MLLLWKWKTPLGLSLSSCFSPYPPPTPRALFSSLCSVYLSLSNLIAICAIIMAHQWEFGWCLSDSNKQGWCRGMLSKWEKIKLIRDHILPLVCTAFVEWILQDTEKSTQCAGEWRTGAGREPRGRQANIGNTGSVLFVYFTYVSMFLGSSVGISMQSIQYRGICHHSVVLSTILCYVLK